MTSVTQLAAPDLASISAVANFCIKLNTLNEPGELRIEFSHIHNYTPFGMILVGSIIRDFHKRVAKPNNIKIKLYGCGNSYASHMNFFDLCGIQVPKPYGKAKGSSNYIPITGVRSSSIKRLAEDNYSPVGEVVEQRCVEMAKVVAQDAGADVIEVLKFCMTEIFRNSIEHGESDWVRYCGQYWPTKNIAEIAIIDNGIGIKSSLNQNPELDIVDDISAIKLAMEAGVSGSAWKYKRIKKPNHWQNSGYGLYMARRICEDYGKIAVVSGMAAFEANESNKEDYQCEWPGTAVLIRLNTKKIANKHPDFDKYITEGKANAADITGASQGPASGASRGTAKPASS